MRKIVFFGNCYAATLQGVYALSLAPLYGDTTSFVNCYEGGDRPESLKLISEADIIVEQVFDVGQKFEIDLASMSGRVIQFPTVSLGFLWPFGLVPHVRNEVLPYWQCGPYDYLMGDNLLNRRINEGVPPEAAVDEYLSLDIAKVAHLDRLYDIMMDRQRARDDQTGMRFADEMEAHFRRERLFLNPYRPNVRMATSLAKAVYPRLGVSELAVEQVTSRWVKTPFERTALPIHPGVAKHFDLSYGNADERYLYHTGERLTFEQFARRYAAYEYNDPLLKGVGTYFWPGAATFREFQGPVAPEREESALADLREGLGASQGSGLGECALARLLARRGETGPALEALERAVVMEPDDADVRESYARLLDRCGRVVEAEREFRAAIERDPATDSPLTGLAHLLIGQGRLEEALTALLAASAVRPGLGHPFYDLAHVHRRLGQIAEAEAALLRAVALLPGDPRPLIRLAEVLTDTGRPAQAHGLLRQAGEMAPGDRDVGAEIEAAQERLSLAPSAAGSAHLG